MKRTETARHGLRNEGAAYTSKTCTEGPCKTSDGQRIANPWGGVSGAGHGRCACGAESPHVRSGADRRRWHAQHKAEIAQAARR